MTDWFYSHEVAPGVTAVTEPHIGDFYRANLYTVRGRDADIQFDFGCGIVPLCPALSLSGAPVIGVASHAHVDHIGGFHEFGDRRGHPAETMGFATMAQRFTLKDGFRTNRFGASLSQLPHPQFDLAQWDLTLAPLTATLAEGDRIALGNRSFSVLHLPGHSPGSIALLDEVSGLLLAGDAVYDDTLLDDIPGASVPDYLQTMARLADLDCDLVLAGHGAPFGRARLREIALGYIRSKD